jgi:RNA polymerase sigma-70 factor, ECF subfamily
MKHGHVLSTQDARSGREDTSGVINLSGLPMTDALDPHPDEARRRFDEACDRLRPDLHRFCTRMTGNPCDGEDVLHDALVVAWGALDDLRDEGASRAWLFRIAHNKCIDFLRRRRRVEPLSEDVEDVAGGGTFAGPDHVDEAIDLRARAEDLLIRIASSLPPKERACVVLKDVLDCSLEETADITGSNVGAVKAALHRARQKLVQAEGVAMPGTALDPAHRALAERYLHAFNARDWDGVRALVSNDARVEVVHRSDTTFDDAPYFGNYARIPWAWKLGLAWVDGVESLVHYRQVDGAWMPHAIVKLGIDGGAISAIRDYVHVDYLLRHARVTNEPPG